MSIVIPKLWNKEQMPSQKQSKQKIIVKTSYISDHEVMKLEINYKKKNEKKSYNTI